MISWETVVSSLAVMRLQHVTCGETTGNIRTDQIVKGRFSTTQATASAAWTGEAQEWTPSR